MRQMQRTQMPCFDPRDPSQLLEVPKTWKPTDNLALVRATLALELVPNKTVDWRQVATIADFCDPPV